MNELCLFAGAGGGLLASKWLLGHRPVCYVERDPYCVEVIKARIRDGYLDDAPIWDDVRTFDGRPWRGVVDCISAGFPCQPFSVAGRKQAANDERNGWPDTIRIIREVQPRYLFLENVPGLLAESHGYFGVILRELAEGGYDVRWRVLSAAELGAPHKRDRLWIVGNAQHPGRAAAEAPGGIGTGSNGSQAGAVKTGEPSGPGEQFPSMAYPNGSNSNGRGGIVQVGRQWGAGETSPDGHARRIEWGVEPDVGRVAYGVASRVDRLRAIGNGQVPIVAATAWELLTAA